jgi:toxin ParE1/3/4
VKNVRFHDEARVELVEQVVYYESSSPGLGDRFNTEVERAVARATEFPGLGSPHKYGTRRVFPKNFPFSVVYLVQGTVIVVLAVAHFRRKPTYWRRRKNDG